MPGFTIRNKQNVQHYIWGDGNEGWRLVDRQDLSVIHERMRAGAAEIPHHHRRARQFFHVQVGTLTMRTAGADQTVGAGQGIEIAPGQVHQAMNLTAGPIEFIVVSSPTTADDRVEAERGHSST